MSATATQRPPATTRLVTEVDVSGFRSVRRATVALEPLSALVGGPAAGKSNLLAAIRAVLDPAAAALGGDDLAHDGADELDIQARLASGESIRLTGTPPDLHHETRVPVPPVLFLPASVRMSGVIAPASGDPEGVLARAARIFENALGEQLGPAGLTTAGPAAATVHAIESCCLEGVHGVVMLIEEPELHLRPQGQRYLYSLLRRFADGGNQVIYSTHSPSFLNVARLGEVVFVERAEQTGTTAIRPKPPTPDADFRVLSEFDAERSELLLARAAMLVEGLTEKLALPFVFAALGVNHDREGITVVECGGKANIPLYAHVCRAAGVPFVAVHDRDALPGRRPRASERAINAEIRAISGPELDVALEPDFEGIARLRRGTHKPEQAWRRFAALGVDDMPEPLLRAARLALQLARASSGS